MKLIIIVLIICLFAIPAFSQNQYFIKGIITDTVSGKKLAHVSVSILNAKDSTLNFFDRTTLDGGFYFGNLQAGKYILLVTYPTYADYVDEFTLTETYKNHDFNLIKMRLKSQLLTEVLIKGKIEAIKIKGDTTEFNPRAYVIQPSANVEMLLKQLPGVSIDRYGKITAQGKTVNTVLVDGEEFFSDDPTLVTRNLRADMIDKVQLYDRSSNQAAFTGIDDGIKRKTINLKLKEDKKNGYFGKVDLQGGTSSHYQEQGIYNRFTSKEKFAVYATFANTGKLGLNSIDNNKYGSSSLDFSENGAIVVTGFGGSELDNSSGRFDGRGNPKAESGGVHYDSKLNNGKNSINTNYKIGSLDINGKNDNLTQTNLPNDIQNSIRHQNYNTNLFRQKFDAVYQAKLDSTSNIKITIEGNQKRKNNESFDATTTSLENGVQINSLNRSQKSNEEQDLFNGNIYYTKKLKKGRTLSVLASGGYLTNKSTGYLNSEINYYNPIGAIDSTENIDQYKIKNAHGVIFSSNITFTQLLSKTLSALLYYGITTSNNSIERKTLDQLPSTSQYNILNLTYSNNFKIKQLSNQIGITFNYKKDKSLVIWGTKSSLGSFTEIDGYTNNIYKRTLYNWFPQLSYQYKFSQQQMLVFNYNGNSSQPNIDQLQPVKINIDPLNITLGNINLNPSFTNRFSLNYNSFRILSGQSINVGGSYSFITHPIVHNTTIDQDGKTVNQYINVNDKKSSNFDLHSSASKKIKSLDVLVELFVDASSHNSYNYVNNVPNLSKSIKYSGGLNLSKYKDSRYDIYLSFSPNYYIGRSSLQTLGTEGGGFSLSQSSTIYLPFKFQFVTDIGYDYTAKTKSFNTDFHRTIVYLAINKTFLKDDKLKAGIHVDDLLNQNTGFSRSAYNNIITQNDFTALKRYFMFSLTYDFSRFGTRN